GRFVATVHLVEHEASMVQHVRVLRRYGKPPVNHRERLDMTIEPKQRAEARCKCVAVVRSELEQSIVEIESCLKATRVTEQIAVVQQRIGVTRIHRQRLLVARKGFGVAIK